MMMVGWWVHIRAQIRQPTTITGLRYDGQRPNPLFAAQLFICICKCIYCICIGILYRNCVLLLVIWCL